MKTVKVGKQPRHNNGRYGKKSRANIPAATIAVIAFFSLSSILGLGGGPAANSAEALSAAKSAKVEAISYKQADKLGDHTAADTERLVNNKSNREVCPRGYRLVIIKGAGKPRVECIRITA